jgi:hypothetical protein
MKRTDLEQLRFTEGEQTVKRVTSPEPRGSQGLVLTITLLSPRLVMLATVLLELKMIFQLNILPLMEKIVRPVTKLLLVFTWIGKVVFSTTVRSQTPVPLVTTMLELMIVFPPLT